MAPQRQVAVDIRKKAPENEKCRGVGMQECMTPPALCRALECTLAVVVCMTPLERARQGPPGWEWCNIPILQNMGYSRAAKPAILCKIRSSSSMATRQDKTPTEKIPTGKEIVML